MSRAYEVEEPSVIDEEMLQKAVVQQGPKDEAKKIAVKEGIKYYILKIDNLWEFTSLTKLQFNNNIIEKIEGLELLVNLRWLDLSFNNIDVIEGLNMLTKLEDLTLCNNQINKIENLNAQQELQIFSVGSNEIRNIKDIIYLRSFQKLKTLNINNNPISYEPNVREYVIAMLPNLEYLDYQLLDKSMKSAAYEMFKDRVNDLSSQEKEHKTLQEIDLKYAQQLQSYKEAFVEYLNTDKLFTDMYTEDSDGNRLKQVPGVAELVTSFKEKFVETCQKMFNFGLEEHEKRKAEEDMFWLSVNEAKKENKILAMTIIKEFQKSKNKLFTELPTIRDVRLMEIKLEDYNMTISSLLDKLMILEIHLVDQLEEVIKDFERNMQELVTAFLESVQGFLAEMRELENIHNEKMNECVSSIQDKASKNELDEDATEELKMLLADKDIVMSSIVSSHDYHSLVIDNKEDAIITGIKLWLTELIETIHQNEEIDRNRTRVIEIKHMISSFQDELDDLEIMTGKGNARTHYWCSADYIISDTRMTVLLAESEQELQELVIQMKNKSLVYGLDQH